MGGAHLEMWGSLRVEGPGALVHASLLNLVSLTGTQGGECHKVGAFPRSGLLVEVPRSGEGGKCRAALCLFKNRQGVDWAEECVRPRQGQQ